MLAQEAHRRLAGQLGDEPSASSPARSVSTSAPRSSARRPRWRRSGEVLVLDEVQWADDPERGSAWTRLLLAGEYRHILLLGAVDALPLVHSLPGRRDQVLRAQAATRVPGDVCSRGLQRGTVVVAFSRRAVLALAGEVNRRRPGKVAVLYGRCRSRLGGSRSTASEGGAVCCATDVLGHGVNLPCETILLRSRRSSTARSGATCCLGDGADRRPGRPVRPCRARPCRRAKRGGLGEPRAGTVESALHPDVRLPDGHLGYRIVDTGRIRPRLRSRGRRPRAARPAPCVAWAALREWATEGWL